MTLYHAVNDIHVTNLILYNINKHELI